MASALKINTNLQILTLSVNPIGDSGASALVQALAHNYKLISCDLDSNTYRTQINALLTRNQQCAGSQQPALQCPLLTFNPFSIQKGECLILTSAHLQITNVNYISLNGNFSISNITHCRFLNEHDQEITVFSHVDINNGRISLQHDGSEVAPNFNVTASYHDLETWPIPAVVNFTLVPLTTRTPFTMSTTTLLPFRSGCMTAVAANSSTSSSSNLGAIIGGAAAGVAALGAAVFALYRYRRRKQSTQIAVLPTNILPMTQNPAYAVPVDPQNWNPEIYATGTQPAVATLQRDPHSSPRNWNPNMYITDERTATLRRNVTAAPAAWDPSLYTTDDQDETRSRTPSPPPPPRPVRK